MYFTKIRLASADASFDLKLVGASPADQYICKGVTGLDPTDLDLSISNGKFQARNSTDRQLVAKIGINPDWAGGQTVDELRTLLYGLIGGNPEDQSFSVIFMNDAVEMARTTCWVEKFEQDMFSKETDVNLTLGTNSPYLWGAYKSILTDYPSLSKTNPVFNIVGTSPTGMAMSITLTADMSSWGISTEGDVSRLEFVYDFLTDDTIVFDTRKGFKSAKVIRSTIETSLLPYLSDDSSWVQLKGAPNGLNDMTISSGAFNWNSFEYQVLYWGV